MRATAGVDARVQPVINYETDPSFEYSAGGWQSYQGSDVPAVDATRFHSGSQSLRLSRGGGFWPAIAWWGSYPLDTDALGRTVAFSAWVWVSAGSADPMLRIDHGAAVDGVPVTAREQWVRTTVAAAVTSDDVQSPRLYVRTAEGDDPVVLWMDDVLVTLSSLSVPAGGGSESRGTRAQSDTRSWPDLEVAA